MRKPTRITVQYRHVPYLPAQVRITRHYGRGIPRKYDCPLAPPHMSEEQARAYCEDIVEKIGTSKDWPIFPGAVMTTTHPRAEILPPEILL